jgi:hypothetical protein
VTERGVVSKNMLYLVMAGSFGYDRLPHLFRCFSGCSVTAPPGPDMNNPGLFEMVLSRASELTR